MPPPSEHPPGLDSYVVRGLACAALHPGLRSILILDTPPGELLAVGEVLVEMLRAATRQQVDVVTLGAGETEQTLWGSWGPEPDGGGMRVRWHEGALARGRRGGVLQLVVVPDLSRLSLAGLRACILLAGADVVHLERDARQDVWVPNCCFLAGCAPDGLGAVSHHLLDRFVLRLEGPFPWRDEAACVAAWLNGESFPRSIAAGALAADVFDRLRAAAGRQASLSEAAVKRVLSYFPPGRQPGVRREISLARLASANALLDGSPIITPAHVDAAAATIGLVLPALPAAQVAARTAPGAHETGRPAPQPASDPGRQPKQPASRGRGKVAPQPEVGPGSVAPQPPVPEPEPEPLPLVLLPPGRSQPFEADDARAAAAPGALRLPPGSSLDSEPCRGPVVGSGPATSLHDLDTAGTLFEAARFQPGRRARRGLRADAPLILSAADLRSFRRAPAPEHLLALVLDYTCLSGRDWRRALAPYFRQAYLARAAISLIQVGAKGTEPELRARRIDAESILVPRISRALGCEPGRATPLAHGLDLALRALDRTTQHGRRATRRAWLVVLTDGRGNVRLEGSRAGRDPDPVHGEGVDDALAVARRIGALGHVEAALLDPDPDEHRNLPILVAEALGARRQRVARLGVGGGSA